MEVTFRDRLVVAEVGDGTVWRLEQDLLAVVDGEEILVPTGFHTDFSSIPRIVRSIIPVLGRQNKASVLHDALYVTKIRTRAEADRIFLAAMRSSGVPLVKRSIMYVAVRIGGWVYWRR